MKMSKAQRNILHERFLVGCVGAMILLAIVSRPANGQIPTVLTSFTGSNGYWPYGDLTISPDGSTLYGMTTYGGSGFTGTVEQFTGSGTIFSIPSIGGSPTILYNFDGPHGAAPCGSLTMSGTNFWNDLRGRR
jgi:hypothetical protein